MPGVPSGRGCDGCRKQKKKCDQASPTCSRCLRLGLLCVGAGVKRYKFQIENGLIQDPAPARGSQVVVRQRHVARVGQVPNSAVDNLAALFAKTMAPGSGVNFNLATNYGGYLQDIPKVLGKNDSLDAAADAIVAAHRDTCLNLAPSISSVKKYMRALSVLRRTLDDPVLALAPETLGAVMLLLTCQGLHGRSEGLWTGHCEGAIQILRARGSFKPVNEFDGIIMSSLKAIIVFEAIFNERLSISEVEWCTFIGEVFVEGYDDSNTFRCLSRVPGFMKRGKAVLYTSASDPSLLMEAIQNHYGLLSDISKVRNKVIQVQAIIDADHSSTARLREFLRQLQVALSIHLGMGIISSCVLSAIDAKNDWHQQESTDAAAEIMRLSKHDESMFPLGAGLHCFGLTTAWLGTNDEEERLRIGARLLKAQERSKRDAPGTTVSMYSLAWMAREIRLQNPPGSVRELVIGDSRAPRLVT